MSASSLAYIVSTVCVFAFFTGKAQPKYPIQPAVPGFESPIMQEAPTPALDSIGRYHAQRRDIWADAWVPADSSYVEYDANGYLTLSVRGVFSPPGTQWQLANRTVVENTPEGLPSLHLLQSWNGVAWSNRYRTYFTYDAPGGNLVESLVQAWDSTQGAWQPDLRYTYVYDPAQQLVADIDQRWDTTLQDWRNVQRKLQTYDAAGRLFTIRLQYGAADNNWMENWYADTLYYDAENRLSEQVAWRWNEFALQWDRDGRSVYTYDGLPKPVALVTQLWINGQWVNNSKNTYAYDPAGLKIDETGLWWQNNAWVNQSNTQWTYDAAQNLTEYLLRTWSNVTWKNVSRILYFYELIVPVAEGPSDAGPIRLYPNPVRDLLTIEGLPAGTVRITLLDAAGRAVQTCNNPASGRMEWPLPHLPAGLYWLHVGTEGGQNFMHRIVVMP